MIIPTDRNLSTGKAPIMSCLKHNQNGGAKIPVSRMAYAQIFVTTRLLRIVHNHAKQLSRMQKICPSTKLNCNPLTRRRSFSLTPTVNLLRFMTRGLFVSNYAGHGNHRFLAQILT